MTPFLLDLVTRLQQEQVKFAIAGGVAVSLQGAVRGTVDIDIVVALEAKNFSKLTKALASLGLQSRLPVTADEILTFRKEYIERRNLIAWSFVDSNDPRKLVDVILTTDLKDVTIEYVTIAKIKLPVLTIKALIAMKEASARPQDLEDCKALKILQK